MRTKIKNIRKTKAEKKRVLIALNKNAFLYFRKYLDENRIDFSLMINELIAEINPGLKIGQEKFEFDLELKKLPKSEQLHRTPRIYKNKLDEVKNK